MTKGGTEISALAKKLAGLFLITFALFILGCGTEPKLPQPLITVGVSDNPGPFCLWQEHGITITASPDDEAIWRIYWMNCPTCTRADSGQYLDGGVALEGEVGTQALYIPTYKFTEVIFEAEAVHGSALSYPIVRDVTYYRSWAELYPDCAWLNEILDNASIQARVNALIQEKVNAAVVLLGPDNPQIRAFLSIADLE